MLLEEIEVGMQVYFDNLVPPVKNNPGGLVSMKDMVGNHYVVRSKSKFWFRLEDDPNFGFSYHPSWFTPAKKGGKIKKVKKSITKKDITSHIVQIRKALRDRSIGTSCANYGVLLNRNNKLHTRVEANDVCHARIRVRAPDTAVAIVDYLGEPKERFSSTAMYKEYLKYADYIINRSAGRHAFIPCTMNSYVRSGVLCNLNESATSIMYSLISLRVGNEKKYHLSIYTKLRELGFSEGVAYVLAFSFKKSVDGYIISLSGNHHPFDGSSCLTNMKQIANNTYRFKGVSFKEKGTDWEIFNTLYSKGKKNWLGFLSDNFDRFSTQEMQWGVPHSKPICEEKFIALCKELNTKLTEE